MTAELGLTPAASQSMAMSITFREMSSPAAWSVVSACQSTMEKKHWYSCCNLTQLFSTPW